MEGLVFRPLRHRPLTDQLLASLGLFLAIGWTALHIWGDFQAREINMPGEDSAVVVGGVRFDVGRIEVIVATLILFALLYLLVYRTHIGRMMRAMAQDEEAASLMGVRVNVVASATFFVGSALGGAAGAFLGALFNAKWDMGFEPLLLALVIIIFGGLGSIAGSIVAGLIIGILRAISVYYIDPSVADLLPFSVLLIVLLIRPRGLFGLHVARA
jgi:branched-chain amino acid transport system permease protein